MDSVNGDIFNGLKFRLKLGFLVARFLIQWRT